MTDETGKNDETKPAADVAPKPSRRQIAMLGAAAPVLLTLPVRGARATGSSENCGVCTMSTFSAAVENTHDYPPTTSVKKPEYVNIGGSGHSTKWQRQVWHYNNNYSCIDGDAIRHKVFSHKTGWGNIITQKKQPPPSYS